MARVDNNNIDVKLPTYAQTGINNGYVITSFTNANHNNSYFATSAGLNYKISNATAMFARATKAYNAPSIADYTALDYKPENIRTRDIYLGELGVKYAKNNLALFASASYSAIKNVFLPISIPTDNGTLFAQSTFGSTRTISGEVEVSYSPIRPLALRLTTTLQNARYTDYKFTADAATAQGIRGNTYDWKGNTAERVPAVMSEFTTTYEFKKFTANVALSYTGKRFSSPSMSYELAAYTTLQAGIGYNIMKGLNLRFWGDNLTNTRALTEGNTRGDQFLNPATLVMGQALPGRTILPRSLWTSLTFSF